VQIGHTGIGKAARDNNIRQGGCKEVRVMTTPHRKRVSQPSTLPTAKVTAGGAAGSVTVVLVYIIGLFHVAMPAEVVSALTVIVTSLVGYLVRDRYAVDARSHQAAAG
jgi:hypothetical protein